LTRSAILSPAFSPWQRLYTFGDDQSFLTMTGMNRHAFMMLEQALFVNSNANTTDRIGGRPPSLDNHGQLGLFLFYLGSKMGVKHLCMIFGITPSSCSRFINKMLKLTAKRLKKNIHAEVRFPSEEKMDHYAALLTAREPLAQDVIGFMDGLSLHSECNPEEVIQNAFYNAFFYLLVSSSYCTNSRSNDV